MIPKVHGINDDFSDHFKETGYVILKDLFDPAEIDEIRSDICRFFETRLAMPGVRGRDVIRDGYAADRQVWRACAKQMHNSLLLLRAAVRPEVLAVLRRLGLEDPVACVHPEVRVDMPVDVQHMQPWHQDWRSGQGSLNSVILWLPLHDVRKEDGALEVLPDTHLWGYAETVEKHDPRRFMVVDKRVETMPSFFAEIDQGQCAIISQMLVHRSGINSSGQPRMTCQLRYADRCDPYFVANDYRVPQSSELVWATPPTPEVMARIYRV